MDNLFQIIFILFLVISIISSILDKKKKQAASKSGNKEIRKPKTLQRGDVIKKAEIKNKQRQFLAEVLGLDFDESVKNKVESVEEKLEINSDNNKNVTWNPEEEFKESESTIYKKEVQDEKEFDLDLEVNSDKTKTIQELISKHEIVYLDRIASDADNLLAKSIKKKLKEKDGIRDFILVSEILGKPKALRR